MERAMPGVKGRSGRRPGPIPFHSKPVALAGRYLEVLIDAWLGGWAIPLGDNRYLESPTKPRSVPWPIKRLLTKAAIERAVQFDIEDSKLRCVKREPMKRPTVEQVLRWIRRRAPANTLRRKKSQTTDEREGAYREYDAAMATAWKRTDN
jgi:hypothetical protein